MNSNNEKLKNITELLWLEVQFLLSLLPFYILEKLPFPTPILAHWDAPP